MLVNCPSCKKHLNVPETAAGKKARCPGCNNVFDIAAPATVAVTPIAPKPQSPQRATGEQEDRPRRRARADHDDDDLDDDRTRAKNRFREEDDDIEGEYDDRPVRRRGRSGSVTQMVGTVSKLLKIASFVLIGYFVIGLINTYLTTAAIANLFGGNVNFRGGPNNININLGAIAPSPLSATLFALIGGGVVYGACLTFMFIAASNATQLTGRGLVMTGLIIAVVLGSLMAIGMVFMTIGMARVFLSFVQPINLLAGAGTTAMLLIAGIRGLSIMANPAVKAAFAANDGGRPGRRRARDDRYDDDEDDEDDRAPRRRRRPRDADDD